MPVTRSTAAERSARSRVPFRRTAARPLEFLWLFAAAIVTTAGLYLVFQAKPAAQAALDPKFLNLNRIDRREQLLPYLTMFPTPAERQLAARKIWESLEESKGRVPNVGALGRIRVTAEESRAVKLSG